MKYKAHYSLVITSNSHNDCLNVAARFKNIVKALNLDDISIGETKSARKGDVLSRNLYITHTAYSDSIVVLRQTIDYVIDRINMHNKLTVITLDYTSLIGEKSIFY